MKFQLITIILTTYSLYTDPPNPRVIAIRCDLVTSRLLGNPSPDQLIVHVELSRFTIVSTALVSDFFPLKFLFSSLISDFAQTTSLMDYLYFLYNLT